MGEEKKGSKKLKYEQPRLVKLSGAGGAGQCATGSGDSDCRAGTSAGNSCVVGTSGGLVPCEVGSNATD